MPGDGACTERRSFGLGEGLTLRRSFGNRFTLRRKMLPAKGFWSRFLRRTASLRRKMLLSASFRNRSTLGPAKPPKLVSSTGSVMKKCPRAGITTVRAKKPACFSAWRKAVDWVAGSTMSSSVPWTSRKRVAFLSTVA